MTIIVLTYVIAGAAGLLWAEHRTSPQDSAIHVAVEALEPRLAVVRRVPAVVQAGVLASLGGLGAFGVLWVLYVVARAILRIVL